MKVRGSIEILKGVFLPNPGGLSPRKGLFAMSDQAGNVQWKDLIIPPVVTGMQYPDSGTVVHNGISVYMSLVEDAIGSDLLEKTIWLELGSAGEGERELTDEQLAAINAAHTPTASNPFATLNDVQNLTVVGSAPIEDILQGSFLYKNVIWVADTEGFDSFGNPVIPGDGITSTSIGWLNFGPFRGPGVIPGGLEGQVLQKASGTDYDTRWVDYAGSHGLQKVVDISKTADKIELIHRKAPEGVFQEAVTSGYPDFYIAWILQTTGGYYVYGNFESYNNNGGKGLLKFFDNGIEDPSFNVGSGLNSYPYSGAEMMEHDGKLYISGSFTEYNSVPASRIVCLNLDGSINTSFVTTGFNNFTIGLASSSDGRIYVCGAFSTYNGISVPRFVKLTLTGDIDTSFIMGTGFNNVTIDVIYIPSTSNLVVLGYFSQYNGEITGNIVMLDVLGARVPSFVSGTGFNTVNSEPNKGVLTPDNKLVIAGYFTEYNGIPSNYIIRLNLDGSVDTSFAIGTGFDNVVYDVKILESGRYLVTGDFTFYQGVSCSGNIILNTDGSIYRIITVPGTLFNIHGDVLLCADDVTLTIKELYGYRLISGSSFTFDELSGKAEYNIGDLQEVTSEEIMPRRLIEELIVDMAGTGHADHLNVTPHDDYLTGTTVQEQLDQSEENIVKSYGLHKANYRNLYQTGIFKVDYDVSVLTVTTDTLLITACNNILFINEVNINVNSNKPEAYILSFGDVSFVANATNTPLSEDTTGVYYVGVDKLGAAVYRDSKVYDQDICYMARLVIDNIAGIYSIESAKYIPDLAENKLNDRDRKVGVSGFIVPSTVPNISFCNKSVTYYKNSVNYSNSKYDPNYLVVPDTVNTFAMSFLFMVPGLPSATILPVTIINPKAWYLPNGDLGGINVADSSYQVYRFLVNVTGTLLIQTKASSDQNPQPGVNAIYANREDAIAWLSTIIFEDILPVGDAVEIGRFYLKAGTPVDGSLLNDIDDFYFFPTVVSSSSSSVGVTEHDNLSGKNDNPAFLHVTEADLISLNDAVHKTPDEVIIGKKTFNPLIGSGAIEINIQNHITNYSDAIVANLNGGSLAGTGFIGGLTIHTTGNKNYGVYFSPSGSGIENSAIHYRRKAGTSGNFVVTLEDEPLGARTFSITDTGIINAMSFVRIGGIPSQFLKADGSVDANVYALASALHTPVTIAPISNGLAIEEATQVLSLALASSTVTGALSSTDWNTFNNKQAALGYTPENIANKSDSYTASSSTTYASTKALVEGLGTKQNTLTNPVTGTFVAGRVPYSSSNSTLTDSSKLLWNNTNSYFEVNGNAPRFTLKNNLNNYSTYFTNNVNGILFLKNHQDKTLAVFSNPVNSTSQPQMAIGNVSSIPTESQLYVYGGMNGANIDARGSATVDEANIDLEGNDWTTSPNSLGFSYFGSSATAFGTMMGYAKNKLGVIRFQDTNYAIINSDKSTGISPIRFGINQIEIGNVNDKGFSYQSDFSSVNSSNPRWLTDKGYVDTGLSTKQDVLNGTGFVKVSGTSVSYDNSTYQTVGATHYVGTTLIANNRASAKQQLAGVISEGLYGYAHGSWLYFDWTGTKFVIKVDATVFTVVPMDISGNATTATNVAWSGITDKPTTLAGYGISETNLLHTTGDETKDGSLTVTKLDPGYEELIAIKGITNGNGYGVYGESSEGSGVYGWSVYGTGVNGQSINGTGVYGFSNTGAGLHGYSNTGLGVYGYSNSGIGMQINVGDSSTQPIAKFQKAGVDKVVIQNDGTVTASTFIGSLTGTAMHATYWGGRPADLNAIQTEFDLVLTRGADAITRLTPLPQFKSWLGLGSNAYSSTAYLPLTGNSLTTSRFRNFGDQADANALSGGAALWYYGQLSPKLNTPSDFSYGSVFQFNSQDSNSLALQIASSINHDNVNSTRGLYFRSQNNLGWKNDWKTVLHDGNYNSYSPTLTGTGASGTWNISVNGSSGSSTNSNHLTPNYNGDRKLNPQEYFNINTGVKVAMTATLGYWSDTLWINGYAGGDVPDMCALHFWRNGQPRMFISSQYSTASAYGTHYEILSDYNYSSRQYFTSGLSVGTAGARAGNLAGANTIAIGDGDTGFRQNGDGVLETYTNNVKVRTDTSSGTTYHVQINGNLTGSASSLGGIDSSRFIFGDNSRGRSKDRTNGNANTSDETNSSGFYFGHAVTGMPNSDWNNWITCAGNYWTGSDGYAFQIAQSFWNDVLKFRQLSTGTWQPWRTVLSDSNFSSYALPLTGGTLTGNVIISTANNSSTTYIVASASGRSATVGIIDGANMYYPACNSGNLYLGSNTTNYVQGAISANSSITATAFYQSSDIRLKAVVEHSHKDVGELKSISYTWKDKSKDQTLQLGYSAQEVQKYIPNAVSKDDNGMLSVNYTQVLIAKIEMLENRIKQLENGI